MWGIPYTFLCGLHALAVKHECISFLAPAQEMLLLHNEFNVPCSPRATY